MTDHHDIFVDVIKHSDRIEVLIRECLQECME